MPINEITECYLKSRNFLAIYDDDDDDNDNSGGDGNNSMYTDESTDMNVDKLLVSSQIHDADPT
jgi:hypothetical protein